MKAVTSILRIRPLLPVKAFISFSFITTVMAGIFILFPSLNAQGYISADPYYLMQYELKQFNGNVQKHSTAFRPYYQGLKPFSITFNQEFYYNNNASNQENMDLRYIGDGVGSFTSINISGYSKFLAFNFEPYTLNTKYNAFETIQRSRPFARLNDAKSQTGINGVGLRKADLYLHYKGLGFGWSRDNMWWGPGLQGSQSMTNNTKGFDHFMVGTIRELRWKNMGVMGRYTFAEINKASDWRATYFTAVTGQVSIYSEQIFTFGLSRNYMTGGVDVGAPWTKEDAQKIVFEGLFIKNLQKLDYAIAGHDPWDQTMSGWFEVAFPKNKLKLYLELGFNDNRFNLWDFFVHPDHAMATTIGFRKYGLLNHPDIVFGFEYANLIKGRHHIFRATPNWYDRSHYDDFSYEGRRWAAHSGSDSDDLLLYFGLMNDKWAIIPRFNFERHGVSTHRPSELKTELSIDARYNYKGYEFGLYYEQQFEAHLGFPKDHYFMDVVTGKRRTNTLILRLKKTIM